MGADLLGVVEAAYQLDGDGGAWLQAITDAAGPLIDAGYGAYGAFIDASDPRQMRVWDVVRWRGDPVFVDAVIKTGAGLNGQDVKDTYWRSPPITTASERIGVKRWHAKGAPNGPGGIGDCAAMVAANARGVGCMVLAPLDQPYCYPARAKRVWGRVVAHVAAMHRLRRRAPTGDGEAVLTPGGKLEHAVGATRSARELLREAALRRERARGKLRRQDPGEALELWRALVAGRWSIVDRFDRDGKRFLIAHENEPEGAGPRALTARERQVATRVAMGHSNKLVAYELGLSVSAVGAYLAGAMRKLGLDARLDLARLLDAARLR